MAPAERVPPPPFAARVFRWLASVADCSGPFTHLPNKWNSTVSPEVLIWEVCPRQSLGFLPSGGQYTSKAPRKSVSGQGAAGAPCALSGNLWY